MKQFTIEEINRIRNSENLYCTKCMMLDINTRYYGHISYERNLFWIDYWTINNKDFSDTNKMSFNLHDPQLVIDFLNLTFYNDERTTKWEERI